MDQTSGDERVDLFRLLVLLGIRMRTNMDRRLAEVGLTTQQATVLTIVETMTDPPSLAQVSRILGTTPQNTRQIVDALVRKGLLVVESDTKDRRARRLILTDLVTATFQDREADDRAAVRDWTAGLDDEEVQTAVTLLQRLAAAP